MYFSLNISLSLLDTLVILGVLKSPNSRIWRYNAFLLNISISDLFLNNSKTASATWASLDLGKIKLVWRGAYTGGTAYTVDDVVQYTDSGLTSSFICTTNSTGNAPSTGGSVHGSWAYLAKGGVAGTDVGTTLTTQGDVL